MNSEVFIEILDPGKCQKLVAISRPLLNRFYLFRIMLIVNVTDDLFENVFDRQ